jgi:hypothetical protein
MNPETLSGALKSSSTLYLWRRRRDTFRFQS